MPAPQFTPNVFNYNPSSNLKNWRKAVGALNASVSRSRILAVGDSTTLGKNATGAQNYVGNNYTGQLALYLSKLGLNISNNSFSGSSADRKANDPRVGNTGGWGASGTFSTVGGSNFQSSATGKLSFTPTVNTDTFIVWYAISPSAGTLSVDANGGTATSVNTNGANNVGSTTITTTLGANTYNVNWVSGTVFVLAVEAFNSAVTDIAIMNAGWNGSTSGNWNAGGAQYNPPNTITSYSPILTLIDIGINDWGGATAIATYKTNIQAVINKAALSGDVILVSPIPSNPASSASPAVQQTYVEAMYDLAATNNLCLIDCFSRWISYAVSNPLGFYGDDLHGSFTGYSDFGGFVGQVLMMGG